MTPSKQLTPVNRIARAKAVLHANGFLVLESMPYSEVHHVHEAGSFHYVHQTYNGKQQTLAMDINWEVQREEPAKLKWARLVLKSYGLGYIWNSPGHYTHLHGDSGSFYREDGGAFKPVAKMTTLRAYRTERLQAAVRIKVTNLWDANLDKRLNAVKSASKYGGTKFPYGIRYTQAVIGAKQTGKWDAQSRKAHDAAVRKIETAMGLKADSVWTKATSSAVTLAKKEAVKA